MTSQMLDVLYILIGAQVVIFLLYLNWQIAGALWRWLDQFFKIRDIRMLKITDNLGNQYFVSKDTWGNVISIQCLSDDVRLQEKNDV
jgi:hypothetical protein